MTPIQIARLSALLNQESLNAAEEKELEFLRTLASPAELAEAKGQGDADTDADEEEEEEEGEGEGDEDEGEESDGAEPSSSAKPTPLDHAKALGSSKASLIARNRELAGLNGRLTAELQQIKTLAKAKDKEISKLKGDLAAVKGQLEEAGLQTKSLSKKVSEELAGLGVPKEKLPASKGDGKSNAPSSEEELSAAIEAAETFEEKAALLDAWDKKNAS